jgi:hypothetical protein
MGFYPVAVLHRINNLEHRGYNIYQLFNTKKHVFANRVYLFVCFTWFLECATII